MALDLQQAERDGWRVEFFDDVHQTWREAEFIGTHRSGDYFVFIEGWDTTRATPTRCDPSRVRNLQPRTVKVPIIFARAAVNGEFRALTPASNAWVLRREAPHTIAELTDSTGSMAQQLRDAGYDPDTGEPFDRADGER